jgi:hypothetical protein
MSACQHFKQAFLQQCVLAGLSRDETHAVVKSALAGLLEPNVKQALGFGDLLSYVPIAAGAVGAAGGYGAAKLQELVGQDEDPDEIKNRETIDALRRAAAQTRMRGRISARQEQMPPSRPLLR